MGLLFFTILWGIFCSRSKGINPQQSISHIRKKINIFIPPWLEGLHLNELLFVKAIPTQALEV